MWIINWWFDEEETGSTTPPPTYDLYRYLGVQTYLSLPEVVGIGQQVIELQPLKLYTLPSDFDWTIRAIEEGRLVAA
jgi:hypothetical protein